MKEAVYILGLRLLREVILIMYIEEGCQVAVCHLSPVLAISEHYENARFEISQPTFEHIRAGNGQEVAQCSGVTNHLSSWSCWCEGGQPAGLMQGLWCHGVPVAASPCHTAVI